jgi:hypothetical protein
MTNLTPGPDLDRLVAEAVGWEPVKYKATYGPLGESQKFLETTATSYRQVSGSDAEALAALVATNEEFSIHRDSAHFEGWQWVVEIFGRRISTAVAPTLREAACAAILAWKEGHKDE